MRIKIDRTQPLDIVLYTLERDEGEEPIKRPRKITVQLQNGELRVLPTGAGNVPKLLEEDKIVLFRSVLEDNRRISHGDDGYKAAAIVVTEEGRMFVSINTLRQPEYFKDCAEQNALMLATQAVAQRTIKQSGILPDKPSHQREIHMMGGREEAAGKKEIKISCPCGKCVDMLSNKAMVSEIAPVYVYPIPQKSQHDITEDVLPLEIKTVEQAKSLKDVDPARNVWRVPIGYLNNQRETELDPNQAQTYLQGARSLLGKLDKPQFDLSFDAAAATRLVRKVMEHPGHLDRTIHDLNRTAVKKDGSVDLVHINQFLSERIDEGIASRWEAYAGKHAEATLEGFAERTKVVRAVVIQLEDGSFRYGFEAVGKSDYAEPNAEMKAAGNAAEVLQEHRIKNVWVMEYRPEDVARIGQGEQKPVMHTSPKEGIERIAKRSVDEIMFHYIPYNNGSRVSDGFSLSQGDIEKLMKSYELPDIFPSNFRGVRADTCNVGAARAS